MRPWQTQGSPGADARPEEFWLARTIIEGRAFIHNLRRGDYELGLEARHSRLRVAAAFGDLARAI
jgi:hypothetical protein